MNYWLVKSDPGTYSWEDLVSEKVTVWDGVRNYQARNYIRDMKKGDKTLFYQSGTTKDVVGIAKIIEGPFQDPTTKDKRWLAVFIEPFKKLKKTVTLSQIKANKKLQNIGLVKQSRLSVMPLKKEEFDIIVAMSK